MDAQRKSDQIPYKIIIKGHLEKRWAEWFDGLTFRYGRDGTTTLSGYLPDQASLHSVLLRIRDLNLTLLSVSRGESSLEQEVSTD